MVQLPWQSEMYRNRSQNQDIVVWHQCLQGMVYISFTLLWICLLNYLPEAIKQWKLEAQEKILDDPFLRMQHSYVVIKPFVFITFK